MRILGVMMLSVVMAGAAERLNVLFIAVDDLRPELGVYGAKHVQSPNIDALAASGLTFSHHYVAVPTCGASRYALLTGRRPRESKALSNEAFYPGKPTALSRTPLAGAQSMPELFRRSGYHTACIGKISHTADGKYYEYDGSGTGEDEVPLAWDELPTPYGKWKRGWGIFFAYGDGRSREDGSGYRPLMEFPDCGDSDLPDGMLADTAISALGRLKDKPFFLALGFIKPHLPFVAPKKYWDLYEGKEIPLAPNKEKGSAYWHPSAEFYGYDFPFTKEHPLSDESAREARRAYFACVSYMDAQVGRVLAELKRLGLEKNTIVVLWGDHGWHLGDNQIWGKHSPLEFATRSPFIIRVPGMDHAGEMTDAVVETVDIFPTLVDLCDPEFKKTAFTQGGVSLVPVLNQPKLPGKNVAISEWRGVRSVRSKDYRLIFGGKNPVELYDYGTDPYEKENVAEKQPKVVKELRKLAEETPILLE